MTDRARIVDVSDWLEEFKDAAIEQIMDDVPEDRMSQWAGMFATKVLTINRERLLEQLT